MRRLALLILLLVLVPVGAMAWLGTEIAADRRAVAAARFSSLTQDRLRDLAGAISSLRMELERGFSAKLEAGIQKPRELRRSEPLFSQVFELDAEGAMRFPPSNADASREEADFLVRTAAIWKSEAILYAPPRQEAPADVQRRRPTSGARGDTVTALAKRAPRGWIPWHWREGLHLIYWTRLPDGGVAGAEIERIVLLSRIVGALPAGGLDDGRIVLADTRGDPVHQWGSYEPEEGAEPHAIEALEHPLESWRLEYYASPEQVAAFVDAGAAAGYSLLALALVLLLLGVYAYRELSRDLREAAQRVGFVTQVSHELKTPLANIRIYAELLDAELEDDPRAERAQVIVSESERLTRLINNILTFARQQRGQLRLEVGAVALDPLVQRVVGHFGPALTEAGIEVTMDLGAPEPVFADADSVEQILANLISNVEKYAKDGASLSVATEQSASHTRLVVQDGGPGIPRAHRRRVFAAFHRVSDRITDGATGTGIGLPISRELAEKNGGTLVLEDSDHGARFVLTLRTKEGRGS